MSWQSILKRYGDSGTFSRHVAEELAEMVAEFLDKNMEVVTYENINYNLNNANDIIEMAKIGLGKSQREGIYTSKYKKFDLTAPKNLKLFMATMKKKGYDMKMFDVKGLLTQGSSSGSPSQLDYTTNIKDAIQMLTRMNKPVNKESVMYEADMEESEWNDKYNKLIQEKLQ